MSGIGIAIDADTYDGTEQESELESLEDENARLYRVINAAAENRRQLKEQIELLELQLYAFQIRENALRNIIDELEGGAKTEQR